jgi:hypothetical protein
VVDPLVLWSLSRRKSASRVPFSLEDGSSWTGVTGSSRFYRKDDEMRIGRSERVRVPGTAMRGVDARYCPEREQCHRAEHYLLSCALLLGVYRSSTSVIDDDGGL